MRSTINRLFPWLAALLTAALLAGCGGSDEAAVIAGPSAATPTPVAAPAAQQNACGVTSTVKRSCPPTASAI